MKKYQSKEEILLSWRRCMERNLPTGNSGLNSILSDERLETVLAENKILTSTFEENIKDIYNIKFNKCLFLY